MVGDVSGRRRRRLVTIVVCGVTGQAGQMGWGEVLQLLLKMGEAGGEGRKEELLLFWFILGKGNRYKPNR